MAIRVKTDKQDALRHARRVKALLETAIQHLKDLPHYESDYPVVKIMLNEEIPLLMSSADILIEEMERRPANNNL